MNENLNIAECASQNAKIRAWLLEGRTITSLQAQGMFGCMRLASRVWDIRNQGLDVKVRRRLTPSGKHIAEYFLDEQTLAEYGQ